jgi:hypothetical protein
MYYANKATCNGGVKFNGIDRKNNAIGYIVGNVLPCCKLCNYAKRTMGYNEFLNWVNRVYKNMEGK